MKVKIFTEGGAKYGLGHISRCSALYDELNRRGIFVELIIQDNGESIEDCLMLNNRIVEITDWQSEKYLKQTIEQNDYCIVDSYCASLENYETISKIAHRAMYIDDYGRLDYPEGIIVNPSLYVEDNLYKFTNNHKYLLGAEYIILRSAFVDQSPRKINKNVKEVLITMGGSDPCHLIPLIMELLCQKYSEIKFNVVLGNSFDDSDLINTKYKNVEYFYNASAIEMRDLMLKSDIAITSAGQSIFELIALKKPFVAIKIAENQEKNVKSLKRVFLKELLIDYKKSDFFKELIRAFRLIISYETRQNMFKSVYSLVDTHGANRIVDVLLENTNGC